jgi:hypothetical protein
MAEVKGTTPAFCFLVTTWKRDLRYAKPCLESIQYWHPDAPIKVIVDGDADAECLGKIPSVVSIDRTADLQHLHGLELRGLLSDLNLFFFDDYDYYIRVDADSAFVGEVLSGLRERLPFDFVSLDGTHLDLSKPENDQLFSQYCFSPQELREMGEKFPEQVMYFSGGHFCVRRGLFGQDYLAKWRPYMSPEFRKDLLFKFNDQSFLNYAVNTLSSQGSMRSELWHVTINGRRKPSEFREIKLEQVRAKMNVNSRIIHWTGPTRRWRFCDHNFGWALEFYRELWYRRIGSWNKWRDIAGDYWDHYSERKTWSKIYHRWKDTVVSKA